MAIDLIGVQNKLLEIVVDFDQFCKEREIKYYLMGGTALGAIRHAGFIPWDDDLDVFMTADNYFRFLSEARETLNNEKYYLQEENTDEWPLFFTKLRLNGTTFIEKDTIGREMHHGLYIDIMCLNYVSRFWPIRYVQYFCALLLTAKTLHKRGYNDHGSLSKKIAMKICDIVIQKPIQSLLLSIVRLFNKRKTKMVGHFFGRAAFRKTSFPLSWLGEPRYVKFESEELPVPLKVENYLALRYGDFMKMPDEETKNQYPSHAYIVDLNSHYTEYMQN